ncbi:MAG: hypothetical protein QMD10_12730 [Desulfitobacteriaceae bacterium]|nr:hypothetical protein [Desulfitobacteriaceae bacterium]
MPDAIKKDDHDEATLKDKLWGFVKGLFGKEQKEEHEDNSDIQKISDELAKAGRAISAQRLAMLKQMQDLLAQLIADGEKYLAETGASDAGVAKTQKGDDGMLIPEEIKKKLPDDVKKQVEELEKKAQETEQLKVKVAELEKKLAEKDQPNKDDDIWKGVNPEIRKRMEELEKRAKEAEELAKKEREERITKEFIAKAAAFQGLPVKPEEFGPVLKTLAEKDPEVYTKIEGVLKAADEAITKGALFKELGRASYGDEGSALAKLEAKAEEIRKSDSRLTKEQAFVKACEENPELYAQYRREVM